MYTWIIMVAAIIVSLLIVIKSADLFVDNIVDVGEHVGISQVILGVTASAVGTSLPEFGSAMISVLSGNPDIGVGVVIGSNIWNIAAILGITAFVAGYIKTGKEELRRDGLMTLITCLILMFFMLIGNEITRVAGIVLIIAYLIYLWQLVKAQKRDNTEKTAETEKSSDDVKEVEDKDSKPFNKKKTIILTIAGLAGLIIGCRIMVWAGVEIAHMANIPEMIIGLFALAIGTSIPELVVTLSAALKKLHGLSMGTILGSNIFNILIGIGVPSLFVAIPIEKLSVTFDAPYMIFVTVLLLLLTVKNKKLSRWGGLILIVVYLIYIITRLSMTM
ncbi:calcium/sodium antiporter [Methanobacterium aggregans]|uniref:calcium/sodium antiporter n=1 Tax=Methanobacterium aggregans TaxID=1615586 RepID=UPI001AEAECC6|nr:calcium/sodium antiporter [Methanobacterium aggregans]MBP2045038.1 cation:H+ antiporter [Methanobacterium aggregans]